MTRLLFSPLATPQHLYPMVPLAYACRAAGHEVLIAGTPSIVDTIVHTGLPAVGVGRDVPPGSVTNGSIVSQIYDHRPFPANWPLYPDRLDREQRAMLDHLGHNSAVAAEAMVDDLVALGREWRPDLIVHDTANFAGAVAAAVLDIPNLRHLTGVGLRPMEWQAGRRSPLPEYAELFHRRGVPVRDVPTMTFDPSPPSLRLPVPTPYLDVRFVPYNGPGVVPSWRPREGGPEEGRPDVRRPAVCVTWGLSVARAALAMGRAALDPYREAVEAICDLDVDVVVTTTAAQLELLGALPERVRVLESAPLHLVLEFCDVIVHQAGDGTALTAAAVGIPQLAITRKPDPALTGARLEAVGAGIHLPYQRLAGERDSRWVIRQAVTALLDEPGYREAAARLRNEIQAQPSPADRVSDLIGLTTRERVAG
jgi:UDP:flavonoid glycosyltransferase YjiC (YdhE family)